MQFLVDKMVTSSSLWINLIKSYLRSKRENSPAARFEAPRTVLRRQAARTSLLYGLRRKEARRRLSGFALGGQPTATNQVITEVGCVYGSVDRALMFKKEKGTVLPQVHAYSRPRYQGSQEHANAIVGDFLGLDHLGHSAVGPLR
jgi:hypothetical protein